MTSDGLAEPLKVPASHRSELRALLALRDTARSLLAAEASTLEDTAEIAELRSQLGGRYRDYQRRYGPINRFTLRRTGRTDPATGEERMARVTPTAVRLLRSDPFAALVQALENFDETTQTATPAGILTGRVVVPRAPRLGADTPQDALAICLDTRGRVDLGEIAHLLGTDPAEARVQLGELVYEDPAEQRLVPAAEYLSGNVRAKLEHARQAAIERPELEGNVRALERVLPADLTVEEIEPRLGAVWIDADTHRQFLAEILEDPDIQVEHPGGAMWAVKGRSWSVQATSVWGTERMPAPALAKAVLGAAPDPGHRRNRRRPPRGQPDRDRRRPRESPGPAGALQPSGAGRTPTAPAGSPASTTAGSTRSCCATTAPRASGSPSPASRARSHPARISAPRSRGCSPSPPSGSSTRSAPARPPRW